MKIFNKIKKKIIIFLIKRKGKKMRRYLDKIIEKRENDFSRVEKDPNSFWFRGE